MYKYTGTVYWYSGYSDTFLLSHQYYTTTTTNNNNNNNTNNTTTTPNNNNNNRLRYVTIKDQWLGFELLTVFCVFLWISHWPFLTALGGQSSLLPRPHDGILCVNVMKHTPICLCSVLPSSTEIDLMGQSFRANTFGKREVGGEWGGCDWD